MDQPMPQGVGAPQAGLVRSAWPTIIGTLSVVMGGLLLTLAAPLLLLTDCPWMLEKALTMPLGWTSLLASTGGSVSGVLLLAGGVLLLRRAESARIVHLVWAGVAIACTAAFAALTAVALWESGAYSKLNGAWEGGGKLLYPAFVLLWFLPKRSMVVAAPKTCREAPRPTWQRVVGWVSIVWVATHFTQLHGMQVFISRDDSNLPLRLLMEVAPVATGLVLPLLLLAAGIVILWRRRLGTVLHLCWAAIEATFCLLVISPLVRGLGSSHDAGGGFIYHFGLWRGIVDLSYPLVMMIGLPQWWRAGQREVPT